MGAMWYWKWLAPSLRLEAHSLKTVAMYLYITLSRLSESCDLSSLKPTDSNRLANSNPSDISE